MTSVVRARLLASTLLVGAATFAAPAMAQVAGDNSGIRAGGATATEQTTPGANAQGEVGMTTSEAAPTTENSQGDIVVTGSLIKNPALIASAPVQVIGQEEIKLRQSNTAEEILRTLPGAVPSIGSAVNNGNGGASYADLRGLGSFRNVVLLDGNRIAPSGLLGRVDLNNIPLALVERVDSLTGGAATTYGADAVAGVLNFITRSDFAGLDASVSNQITERGDGNYVRADITVGANFDDGRGNAVFSIGYQQSDPVYQGERDYSIQNYDSFSGAASGSGTTTPSVFSLGGRRQINPATGALSTTVTPFNFNPYNIFQTPFERFNMYGAGHYDVSDSIQVYTRGLFSKNTVDTIIAPSGVFNSSVVIPLSNPYLPAAARTQFCAAANITVAQCAAAALATSPTDPNFRTITTNLSRRTTEVGPRISNYQTTIFDYRAGVKVGLTEGLNLDVSGGYGESENTQTLQGYVLTSRVRSAVYATNTTTCLTGAPQGAAITAGSGCVPLNVFGADGSIAANQIPYITGESTTTVRTSLAQARAVLNGDFGFASPFATDSVGFAAGTEYRKYRASQRSDTLAQTAGELGGAGGAAPNIDGGYEVTEGFGELIAPLVQDRPFFQSLTLEAGVRYSHYKVFAANSPTYNTTTYKAGGSWEPAVGLKIRGNYQRAVRAPNISELFSPVTTGLTNLATDPCAAANAVNPSNNATLRAVCLAQGATTANVNAILNPTGGQANVTSGGNLNLRPEKSDSYTVGVVLQPTHLIPGFSATVDYFNIKIKQAVSSFTPGDIISACFQNLTADSATSSACQAIVRNPVTGGLDGDVATTPGLLSSISNLGNIKTDGIDLGMNYRTSLIDNIKLALAFNGTWTHSNKFQAFPGALNRECVGYYSANCLAAGSTGTILPEFAWNTRATFTFFDNIDISALWRHIDNVRYEPAAITSAATTPFSGTITTGALAGNTYNFGRIPAYNYIDLATRIGIAENLDFTITVQNLFDKKPPVVGSTLGSTSFNSGNTYPSTYDSLGRRFAIGARLHF
jgi:outer membrane receptor protein involved in Fe transport